MIVDLNPMPYMHAIELVRWCYLHDIDKEQCARIIAACSTSPAPTNFEWEIDVPERFLTYFILKWG